MSINAQLAQGSKFYIAGSATGAKTITGIAVGWPTIITSTTHGLTNGDVVTFASIVGTVGTDSSLGLNGKTYAVKNCTISTFAIEVNTLTLAYTSGGTATPLDWTQIKEIKSVKPAGAASSKIDVTDLESTAKEFRSGLMDNGTLACDIHILETDAGQAAALAAFKAGTIKNYKLVSPAKTRTFAATCTKFPTVPDSSVDGVQTGTAEWQISGDVTVS